MPGLEMRARRRWAELKAMGIRRAEQDVVAELGARDAADKTRPVSPLKQAPDADLLDTSDLGIDAAFAAALALVSPKVREARSRTATGAKEARRPSGIPLTYSKTQPPRHPAWEVRRGHEAAGRHERLSGTY